MAKKIPSDQPTTLIAPSDYEHIFKADIKNLLNDGQRTRKKQAERKDGLVKVPSEAPTALIAPSDYEHIFKGELKEDKRVAIKKITSDTPTALIAPSDFQHIYCDPAFKEFKKNKISEPKQQIGGAIGDRQQSCSKRNLLRKQEVLPPSVLEVVQRFISKQKKTYTIKVNRN